MSQIVLERVLRRCAEQAAGAQIHFGWRLDTFTVHDDHVVAEVEDTQRGERHRIATRYLLGID
ncbi:MAG TPA: FAD-dependent monooxygenase, partial [Xanthobacteraceae bacterium]|nr:FAD-dependent monooxygenase [Xanthobacteraceae bacterium]